MNFDKILSTAIDHSWENYIEEGANKLSKERANELFMERANTLFIESTNKSTKPHEKAVELARTFLNVFTSSLVW